MDSQSYEWFGTLKIRVSAGSDLAIADLTSSDPYCVTTVICKQELLASHKTKVLNANLNPNWNETFSVSLYKLTSPILVKFSVWDKDTCLSDDFLGQHEVEIIPTSNIIDHEQIQPLQPRKEKKDSVKVKGSIRYTLSYTPGIFESLNAYKYHNHKFTGLARSFSAGESARIYGTYEIKVHHVGHLFGDHWQEWNKNYDAAKKIFGSSIIKGTIATQHNHLYSEISVTKKGVIKSGEDLISLLKHGVKGGKPRFYTYALKDDTWYFSETGASFFVDYTSKHAMHACVSEQVRYAGEFHFQQNENGTYKLVIDNNSGTYSPSKDLLPQLKTVFEINFSGLVVEALDYKDPKLAEYKKQVTPDS